MVDDSLGIGGGITTGNRSSWTELKASLGAVRRRLSTLSCAVPSAVSFRSLPNGAVRLYFLGSQANTWETTLYFTDLSLSEEMTPNNQPMLQWLQTVEWEVGSAGSMRTASREEQLLIERKRLTTGGITSYQRKGSEIVFPANGTLYRATDPPIRIGPLCPTEIKVNSSCAGSKMSPELSPSGGDFVAFVCQGDVFVWHRGTSQCERVSYCCSLPTQNGISSAQSQSAVPPPPITAGLPSYVMQEEFSRYEGIWWQPHRSTGNDDGVRRLLYEEIDDSGVGLHMIASSPLELVRFPRAGTPNSLSTLRLAEVSVIDKGAGSKLTVSVRSLVTPLQLLFPWMEYLVRIGWTNDASSIWVEMVNRMQSRLELAVLPIDDYFGPAIPAENLSPLGCCGSSLGNGDGNSLENGISPIPVVITSHVSDVWINVHDIIQWMPSGRELIWASEDTGFRHLHYIRLAQDFKPISNVALTSGEWEVCGDDGVWVDSVRRLVYFTAVKDTPLEKHLYVVLLDEPNKITRLTTLGYSYTIDMDTDSNLVVAVYSNLRESPACQVFRIDCSDINAINLIPIGYLLAPAAMQQQQQQQLFDQQQQQQLFDQQQMGSIMKPISTDDYLSAASLKQPLLPPPTTPTLHSHTLSNGQTLHAMVFPPHNYKRGQSYPTVLNVYGGPEVQTVSNTFKGIRIVMKHMLAEQGYCVVTIDSRGSRHRGLAFEGYIKNRMGQVELEDQIEVLTHLASTMDSMIDMSRVAIYGWSYGGYLSLMGLAKYPNIFKVCIAGAPVTCWSLYDTGYTERYMGTPESNPDGYNKGSVLMHVDMFPDEENRLLIIHGLMDENVHFTHTTSLISKLVSKGKPYSLQVYPGERHSLRSLDASKHYEAVVMSFLHNYL